MEKVAPAGPVYQAGTLSGNPLAMTAGLETLSLLNEERDLYEKLEERCARLEAGIRKNIEELGLPLTQNRVGSMATLFFTPVPVTDYHTALKADTGRFARYFQEMLRRGIYLAPSQFEAGFVSTAHSAEDIERTIAANREALRAVYS